MRLISLRFETHRKGWEKFGGEVILVGVKAWQRNTRGVRVAMGGNN